MPVRMSHTLPLVAVLSFPLKQTWGAAVMARITHKGDRPPHSGLAQHLGNETVGGHSLLSLSLWEKQQEQQQEAKVKTDTSYLNKN